MLLLNLNIFLTLIVVTKQDDLYWNFISSNEFRSNETIPILKMENFILYNNSNNLNKRLCSMFLTPQEVYITSNSTCSNCEIVDQNKEHKDNILCPLHGMVNQSSGQSLIRKDVFILMEGCYIINQNGSKSFGMFLITNFLYFEYYDFGQGWGKLIMRSEPIFCNMLCENVFFNLCFKDLTKKVDKDILVWPTKSTESTYTISAGTISFLVIFGVIILIICICVIYKFLKNKLVA